MRLCNKKAPSRTQVLTSSIAYYWKLCPGGDGVASKLTDQLVAELQRQAEEINRLQYGEVILKIQDGRVMSGEINKKWKADSKTERPGA